MSPEEIALAELYNEYRCSEEAKEVVTHKSGKEKISQPLLVKPFKEYLERSKKRLMYVGQETCGWGKEGYFFEHFVSATDSVRELMKLYQDFNFSENSPRHKRSPFWRFHRGLCAALNIDCRAMIWTNLMRCDVDAGRVLKTPYESVIANFQTGLLHKEIEILKPDVILFFTGTHYDQQLERSLGAFKAEQILEDCQPRQLARLRFQEPFAPIVFRTYHPKYLQISKLWEPVAQFFEKNLNCI